MYIYRIVPDIHTRACKADIADLSHPCTHIVTVGHESEVSLKGNDRNNQRIECTQPFYYININHTIIRS